MVPHMSREVRLSGLLLRDPGLGLELEASIRGIQTRIGSCRSRSVRRNPQGDRPHLRARRHRPNDGSHPRDRPSQCGSSKRVTARGKERGV
jgi:hypothetical protein